MVVIVEGISDQLAVEALARRRGRDLDAEGISIVPIGGAHSIGPFLSVLCSQELGLGVAGLCGISSCSGRSAPRSFPPPPLRLTR
jgi:hypothetical protein